MTKPLYKMIKDTIKEKINDGTYSAHTLLPSENQLAIDFNVSRITSKRALNDLESEGLIYRKRGLGSYVAPSSNAHIRDTILFMMPFTDSQNFANYTSGMLEILEGTPYRLELQQHLNLDTIQEILHDYAGIIFYPHHNQDIIDLAIPLVNMKKPTIILDKALSGIPFTSVISNNFQGGYEACRHVIEEGARKLAFISSHPIHSISSVRERYFGYLKAINEYDIHTSTDPLEYIPNQDNSALINRLRNEHYEALVCENDIIAISLMHELKREGLDIPSEIKIIGFDNAQASSMIDPPLSTIEQNFRELGRVAMQELLKQIENNTIESKELMIDVSLIKRQSTQNSGDK